VSVAYDSKPIETRVVSDAPVLESLPIAADAPLFLVLNRGSGHHDGEDVRQIVETTLREAGRVFTIEEVTDPTELGKAAARAVERAKQQRGIVVAAGGDGTINTVAEATLGSGCAFGVLPLGTFNYFGRVHGIPSDPLVACQILLSRRVYAVQVGLVNERVFLVNGSIGLYPDLLEKREQAKSKLGRSRWVAFVSALATLFGSHRSLRIEVESRLGKARLTTPTLFVGNNRLQLERVGIRAAAALERHRLVGVVLRPVGVWGMMALVVRALLGRLGDDDRVTTLAFERMTVRSRFGRGRFKVATDGEITWMNGPLTFRVAPHPLLLLRPEEAGADPG
jgi:diacylglycerol kinase family enzyme